MVVCVLDVARNNKIHNIWKITIFSKVLVIEVPDITNFIDYYYYYYFSSSSSK